MRLRNSNLQFSKLQIMFEEATWVAQLCRGTNFWATALLAGGLASSRRSAAVPTEIPGDTVLPYGASSSTTSPPVPSPRNAEALSWRTVW